MIRHLLVLTWNRRRTNLLLLIEIFVAFLALTALVTLGAWGWQAYHEDRGFDLRDVWRVGVQRGQPDSSLPTRSNPGPMNNLGDTPRTEGPPPRLRDLLAAITALPQVVDVAAMTAAPSSGRRGAPPRRIIGRPTSTAPAPRPRARGARASPCSAGAGSARPTTAPPYRPVVITEGMARATSGRPSHRADPAAGPRTPGPDDRPPEAPPILRVVGLVGVPAARAARRRRLPRPPGLPVRAAGPDDPGAPACRRRP